MSASGGAPSRALLLLVAALLGWLLLVGTWIGPATSTETRYSEVGREMLESRDWVVPTFNGAPHLEKPPFHYWVTAASYALLGVGDAAARVPSLLAAGLVLLVVGAAARRLARPEDPAAPSRAAGAVVALGTMPAFLAQGYTISTDVWLMLTTTVAGLALLESERARGRPALRWTLLLHLAFGVGMLVKGPLTLGLVLGPALVAALLRRDARPLRPFVHPLGLLVLAAVAVPWYVAADARFPGLLRSFVDRRLVGGLASSADFHANPVWIVWVPLLGTLPWAAALPVAVRTLRSEGRWRDGPGLTLLLLALAAPVLFTVSRSRLVSYSSPAFPWVALLLALGAPAGAAPGANGRLESWRRALAGAAWGTAAVAVGVAGWAVASAGAVPAWSVVAVAAAGTAVAVVAGRRRGAPLARPFPRVALAAACLLVVGGAALVPRPFLVGASRSLWDAAAARRRPDDELGAALPESGNWGLLPWCARRPVRFFGYPSRLRLVAPEGVASAKDRFLPVEDLVPWFSSPARRFLMLRGKDRARLLPGLESFPVAQGGAYVIVTNHPLPAAGAG